MTDPAAPGRLPAGATVEGDGIMVGRGPVRVDAFIDFLCPFCRQFELSSGPALAELVASGQVGLREQADGRAGVTQQGGEQVPCRPHA